MTTKNWTIKTALANTDYIIINSSIEVCTFNMIFFNTNSSTAGDLKMRILDSGGVEKAKILEIEVLAKDSIMLDTKLFLNPNEKLVVNSTIIGIDCTISGTEG
jgi:hypothetical protein